ncbi:MAG: hypothetical protein AAGE59_33440 [Cyanobacteria bacterium P01_F01_bin.86]
MKNSFKLVKPLLIASLSIVGATFLQAKRMADLDTLTPEASDGEVQSQLGIFDSSLKNLGLNGLSSSLLWLDFVQYYGSVERQVTGYQLSDMYLTLMTESEPRFTKPYDIATSALAFRSAQPERALEILNHGLNHVSPEISPSAYILPFEAGTISFLYLGDGDGGRRNYQLAADWFEESTGESAQHWRDIGNRLFENPRSRRVQFDVWSHAYNVNPDPDAREFILARLAELGEVRRYPDGRVNVLPPPDDF